MTKTSEALSPWGMQPVSYVNILPLEGKAEGRLALPGSKSFTNRALVIAALAKGKSTLHSPLYSDDSYWCVDALNKIGIQAASDTDKTRIVIEGGHVFQQIGDAPYIGSAGTIARFLPGALAARGKGQITLTSSSQLAKRPVAPLVAALRQLGAEIELPENGSFPMKITGGSLIGGKTEISGKVSSQFLSGLLIAAPMAKEPVTIIVPDTIVQADYVRMTLQMIAEFGVQIDYNDTLSEFSCVPQEYQARETVLEADASTSTYFFALAAATGGKITVTNLNPETLQPDFAFVDHLRTLGCRVEIAGSAVTVEGPDVLKGHADFDFNACSDSTPTMLGVAPFADGPVTVRGVAHIRAHECDRLSVSNEILTAAGLDVEEYPDGLRVTPKSGAPVKFDIHPHDDHRMAMAYAVTAAAGQGGRVFDPSCVSKTCPSFFDLIGKVGVRTKSGAV